MNSSFSDKMTKPDAVEDLSDKSYPQVNQEKADIQAGRYYIAIRNFIWEIAWYNW